MKQKIPKELNEYLGTTPKAIHSAYYMDFADGYNKIKDLLYRPCNMDEVDDRNELINEFKESVNNAYVQLTTVGMYWQFCTFKVYKETYESRKEEYFKTFFDATEYDFIDEELFKVNDLLNEFVEYLDETGYPRETDTPILYEVLNNINFKNVQYSQSKKGKFLTEQKKNLDLENNSSSIETKEHNYNKLKWQLTGIEVAELAKALTQAKKIVGFTDKDVFDHLSSFFDVKFDKKSTLQTIGKRSVDKTSFLDVLTHSLENWINQSDSRKNS